MLAPLGVAAVRNGSDRGVVSRVFFRFPVGQVRRYVAPLDGLQPVDCPLVAVLPELQVRPGVAEVDEMPGGDILDEYQQQLVPLASRRGENACAVETGKVAFRLGYSRVDGGLYDGRVPPRDGFDQLVMQVGVQFLYCQKCHDRMCIWVKNVSGSWGVSRRHNYPP